MKCGKSIGGPLDLGSGGHPWGKGLDPWDGVISPLKWFFFGCCALCHWNPSHWVKVAMAHAPFIGFEVFVSQCSWLLCGILPLMGSDMLVDQLYWIIWLRPIGQ